MLAAVRAWFGANRLLGTILIAGALVLALAATGWAIYRAGGEAAEDRIAAENAEAISIAKDKNLEAHDEAAEEQKADEAATAADERAMNEVAETVPASALSDRRVIRNCCRLRRQGDDLSKLSACRRFADRVEAHCAAGDR